MIRISPETVNSAFECLAGHERYNRWFSDFQATLRLYAAADKAFDGEENLAYFIQIYDTLRGYWQVFRRSSSHWSLEKAHAELLTLAEDLRDLRRQRLSEVNPGEWQDVWEAIGRLRDIKQTLNGPSPVAVSKFLHFWNPHLFVIFDRQVVENWVFGHSWLADQLGSERVGNVLRELGVEDDDRLSKYLRVLVFAGDLVNSNPHILSAFAETVQANAGQAPVPRGVDISSYEATAVEWCLLGLVELPPAGVEVSGGTT